MVGAASDVPATGTAAKATESSAPQRSTRAVPKPPASQSTSVNSDSTAPATPAKSMSRSFGDRSIIIFNYMKFVVMWKTLSMSFFFFFFTLQ